MSILIRFCLRKGKVMKKNYQCHFDFDEVSGGAIITEYDEDAPMVAISEQDVYFGEAILKEVKKLIEQCSTSEK